MSPDFLTLEEVLDLHALQLARYGGGVSLMQGSEVLYELTLSVASGSTTKAEVAHTLQRLAGR